jgi:ankyrin repeat protein
MCFVSSGSAHSCLNLSRRRLLALVCAAGAALAQPAAAQSGAMTPAEIMRRAVQIDDPASVRRLIDSGADVNMPVHEGLPPLHLALMEGSLKAAETLANHAKVQINAASSVGDTPLMIAALKGQGAMVDLLLKRGARPAGAADGKGLWTPLHYAALGGHDAIAERLLAAAAPVNATAPNGATPIMLAARGGHDRLVRRLLRAGADTRARTDADLDVVSFARRNNHPELADAIPRWAEQARAGKLPLELP